MWPRFDVAVCIVLKDANDEIREGLPRILSQKTRSQLEVIIVDSGSKDGSREYVRSVCEQRANVRLVCIEPQMFHHARTRNYAAGFSQARYRVFLNGDAVPTDDAWLERLMAPMTDGGERVALSFSRQECRPDADTNNRCRMAFNYGEQSVIRGHDLTLTPKQRYFFSSVSCCVDTELLQPPLFREDLPVNEDMALAARALLQGCKLAYCADSVVRHSHNYGYRDILRRSFDNAVVYRRLGFFGERGPGASRDGFEYLVTSVARLRDAGIGARVRFLLFYSVTAAGAGLGRHHRWLPRCLAKRLTVYGTV